MASNTIKTNLADGVLTLTLNRPDKLNSFNAEMSRELQAALGEARSAAVRAVLLTGAGKGFCAGQDLSERATAPGAEPPDLGATLEAGWNPIVRAIRGLAKPVVCAVNGVAAGAGANMALACDIVLAARSAKFIQPFCRLGLVPDSGGTFLLPRLVGQARAKGLTMLGEPLSAGEAESWGLIWKAVDDDKLMPEANRIARHLAMQPTFGLGLIKQAIEASAQNSFDVQLDLERDCNRRAGRTPDYAEGVRAFLEKRPPRFTGTEQ